MDNQDTFSFFWPTDLSVGSIGTSGNGVVQNPTGTDKPPVIPEGP